MNDALAWIGYIAEWFGKFIPRWIILSVGEGAVKFVRGSRVVVLEPGIHWYWPATTEIRNWPMSRQVVNLPTQTITTQDGKVIAVGAVMVFRLTNVLLALAHTFDVDQTIRAVAAGVVQRVCSQATWEELQQAKDDGVLDRHLKRGLVKALRRRFGVQVLDATLTDFAPCRVIKVIQSMSSDT